MTIISDAELRVQLKTTIPSSMPQSIAREIRLENIQNFNALARDNLESGKRERRLLLYRTKSNEEVYIQYPGKETLREGSSYYPLDFKPILKKNNGTIMDDMDFNAIWDKVDEIGQRYNAHLDILGILFLRMAYMIDYVTAEGNHQLETINVRNSNIEDTETIQFKWNKLYLVDDVIETLNDHFSNIGGISLEGFLYYNDLLAQNEDCKYNYKSLSNGQEWDHKKGRINNCLSHLSIIAHLQGRLGISSLIDRFQKGRGVGPIPQKDFIDACGNLIERISL